MKFIRYGKYVGEPADAVDLEELIKRAQPLRRRLRCRHQDVRASPVRPSEMTGRAACAGLPTRPDALDRSEEHTSELQSHSDLVCRLLLEKKKQKTKFSRL